MRCLKTERASGVRDHRVDDSLNFKDSLKPGALGMDALFQQRVFMLSLFPSSCVILEKA